MAGLTDAPILLSTDHCTLCERALDLLAGMPELRGLALRVVDVADDPRLMERYGERVPVLLAGGAALDWPFTAPQVLAHLGAAVEPR